MVVLLLIACFLLLVVAAGVISAIVTARAVKNGLIEFVSSPGKDKEGKDLPSPLAQTIDMIAISVASRTAQSIQASFNGQASGMARGMKAIEADIASATLAQNGSPLAQILGGIFQKQLRKNPGLAMALSQFKMGGGSAPGNNHSDHGGSQASGFTL